jgi:hypothetical protein
MLLPPRLKPSSTPGLKKDATEALSMLAKVASLIMWLFKSWVGKEEPGVAASPEFDTTSTILVVDGIAVEEKSASFIPARQLLVCRRLMVEGVLFQLDNDTKKTD